MLASGRLHGRESERKGALFQRLHQGPTFVIGNAWDGGSAHVFQRAGFVALATSSGAAAATLGRKDGELSRDEALGHAAVIVGATNSTLGSTRLAWLAALIPAATPPTTTMRMLPLSRLGVFSCESELPPYARTRNVRERGGFRERALAPHGSIQKVTPSEGLSF